MSSDPHPCPRCIPDEPLEPLTMGRPNRWLRVLRFRCLAGHVTGGVLRDMPRCRTCDAPALLTFPEDTGATS
jgi:hypothetical protein